MSKNEYEINQLPEIGDIVYINNAPYVIWRMPNDETQLIGLDNHHRTTYYDKNLSIEDVLRKLLIIDKITLRDGTPVFKKVNRVIKCGDIIEWDDTEYIAVEDGISWMFVSKRGTRLMANIRSRKITIDDINIQLNILPEAVLLDKKWE